MYGCTHTHSCETKRWLTPKLAWRVLSCHREHCFQTNFQPFASEGRYNIKSSFWKWQNWQVMRSMLGDTSSSLAQSRTHLLPQSLANYLLACWEECPVRQESWDYLKSNQDSLFLILLSRTADRLSFSTFVSLPFSFKLPPSLGCK